jgi:hypothetical protein
MLTVSAAEAVPPVRLLPIAEPPKLPLHTLASVGRADGHAGHEVHGDKLVGLSVRLKGILYDVAKYFRSPVTVTSGCRSSDVNQRVGGAQRSLHLSCLAADIKVAGVSKFALARFAEALPGVGGIGTYCSSDIVHIDLGVRRTWFRPCRRKAKRS